jgi:hypothetical protein
MRGYEHTLAVPPWCATPLYKRGTICFHLSKIGILPRKLVPSCRTQTLFRPRPGDVGLCSVQRRTWARLVLDLGVYWHSIARHHGSRELTGDRVGQFVFLLFFIHAVADSFFSWFQYLLASDLAYVFLDRHWGFRLRSRRWGERWVRWPRRPWPTATCRRGWEWRYPVVCSSWG